HHASHRTRLLPSSAPIAAQVGQARLGCPLPRFAGGGFPPALERHTAPRILEALSEITSDFERAGSAFAEPMLFDSASAGDSTALVKVGSKLRSELAHFEARLTAHDHLAGAALSAADLAAYTGVMLALRAAGKDIAKDLDLQLLPLDTHYPRLAE